MQANSQAAGATLSNECSSTVQAWVRQTTLASNALPAKRFRSSESMVFRSENSVVGVGRPQSPEAPSRQLGGECGTSGLSDFMTLRVELTVLWAKQSTSALRRPFFINCNINDPHRPFYGSPEADESIITRQALTRLLANFRWRIFRFRPSWRICRTCAKSLLSIAIVRSVST